MLYELCQSSVSGKSVWAQTMTAKVTNNTPLAAPNTPPNTLLTLHKPIDDAALVSMVRKNCCKKRAKKKITTNEMATPKARG